MSEQHAAPDAAPRVDPAAVQMRARLLSHLIEGTCGGGVEALEDEEGVVRVRFTGLCTACICRPGTFARWVKPGFRDLEGVTAVEADGTWLSSEAEARLVGPE